MKSVINKKKFLHISLCILLILVPFYTVNALFLHTFLTPDTPSTAATYKTILIDAGHGGIDTGTYFNNIYEKDINLQVALKLKDILISKDYIVIMSRETDMSLDKLNSSSLSRHKRDLNQRVAAINSSNTEIFISIHTNSLPGSDARGPMVFHDRKDVESKKLSSYIQDSLNKINYNGYTVNPHKEMPARLYLFGYTPKPGALVELGFMTCETDRALLTKPGYQEYIANKIFEGIEGYYNSPKQIIGLPELY